MRRFLIAAALIGLALGMTACAHPHRHHAKPPVKVVHLDGEHDDPKIVVIHKKRAPHRHCWKHARHWHCRR